MRGVNGDSNSALATISAAATAMASAESRGGRRPAQKRRWGDWWSVYWCFGSYKHKKRIGHAVLVPETTPLVTNTSVPSNPNLAPSNLVIFPFIAPPSSPASFLQSEPPSMIQSPSGVLSFSSGPASIFAIGPYAHETQLVSPPIFSTFTTEPSTAPFTPPPESVHLTTPSSPEVPFARLLDPSFRSSETGQRFPFSYYEFQPGSPIAQLISPRSGVSGSGTSSPFPDPDIFNSLAFRVGDPPNHEWGSRRGSGSLTPDAAKPKFTIPGFLPDHRVSFELSTENGARRDQSANALNAHHNRSNSMTSKNNASQENLMNQKNMSVKEFNFESVDDFPKPTNGNDWSFFPMIQPGLS